jgi:hypothetical protein
VPICALIAPQLRIPPAAKSRTPARYGYQSLRHIRQSFEVERGFGRSKLYRSFVHIGWIDALVTCTSAELATLRKRVNQFVLNTLKSQEFDPTSVEVEPPLFRLLLDGFDMTAQKGEPTGASLQGIAFGFLRADNPHLQIEIDKVRTGSKRLQRTTYGRTKPII